MTKWVLSGFQKEFIFSHVRQLKAKLHERQERVRQARELLISMMRALIYGLYGAGKEGRDLLDKVTRFIEEETE